MQPHSLLDQQKRAADRSAQCHVLSRLRIAQGYYGAAKFYQSEAARLHVRACELREQLQNPQPLPGLRVLNVVISDLVTDPRSGFTFKVARYVPTVKPVHVEYITGSKPWPHPDKLAVMIG